MLMPWHSLSSGRIGPQDRPHSQDPGNKKYHSFAGVCVCCRAVRRHLSSDQEPKKIVLNEALQLSCQGQAAFVVPDVIEFKPKQWLQGKLVEKPIQRVDIEYYMS